MMEHQSDLALLFRLPINFRTSWSIIRKLIFGKQFWVNVKSFVRMACMQIQWVGGWIDQIDRSMNGLMDGQIDGRIHTPYIFDCITKQGYPPVIPSITSYPSVVPKA